MLDDLNLSRAQLLRGALATGGGIAVAGVVIGELPAAESAPSPKQDAEILKFVLGLEYLQAAFYAEAVERGRITDEPREFARVVGGHEREHVVFIEKALGGAAASAQRYDFGDATADPAAFLETARKLEDLAIGAYNAGAPNLTKGALVAAARIASVEARHAAWIRDIAGLNPAPDASEPLTTPAKVTDVVRATGFMG